MSLLREIKESFLQLLFPHTCAGCGTDIPDKETMLCFSCLNDLPETGFEQLSGNPVEKKFWGRLPVQQAAAHYFFSGGTLMQRLIHQLKYRGNKELGLQLGRIMGRSLKRSGRFYPDVLVPLPLFPAREKRRGYNQSVLLCRGIAEEMNIPIESNLIIRSRHTETQTQKGRIERWLNIEGKFALTGKNIPDDRHILLVDDVITTGATLEACGTELLKIPGSSLSIACLCVAGR